MIRRNLSVLGYLILTLGVITAFRIEERHHSSDLRAIRATAAAQHRSEQYQIRRLTAEAKARCNDENTHTAASLDFILGFVNRSANGNQAVLASKTSSAQQKATAATTLAALPSVVADAKAHFKPETCP